MKTFKSISYLLTIALCIGFVSCSGSNNKASTKASTTENTNQALGNENIFEGVWDYTFEGDDHISEIIFFKDGSFIDYIDFHTTGKYTVSSAEETITMDYYDMLDNSLLASVTYKYSVTDNNNIYLANEKFQMSITRKEKSINYTGDVE